MIFNGSGAEKPSPEQNSNSMEFRGFVIDNPKIPDNEDDWLSFVDEEDSIVNISNLKRSEVKKIIEALKEPVKQAEQTCQSEKVSVEITDGRLDLDVSYIDDLVIIEGRLFTENDNEGSYFHDFVIEGISVEDWQKISELLG